MTTWILAPLVWTSSARKPGNRRALTPAGCGGSSGSAAPSGGASAGSLALKVVRCRRHVLGSCKHQRGNSRRGEGPTIDAFRHSWRTRLLAVRFTRRSL
jgi:hypothetical protein